MDDAFGNWLAGFFDGEGCFLIGRQTERGDYHLTAQIGLRLDDLPILKEIQKQTQIGQIHFRAADGRNKPQARWRVLRKVECQALCQIFDRYPLRAKKARDYALWREAVRLRASIRRRGRNNPSSWVGIEALHVELKRIRQYESADEVPELVPSPQLYLFEDRVG